MLGSSSVSQQKKFITNNATQHQNPKLATRPAFVMIYGGVLVRREGTLKSVKEIGGLTRQDKGGRTGHSHQVKAE